mgnify:CR=1 FL=1
MLLWRNGESKYDQIHKRNAFALLDKVPSKVEVPPLLAKPPVKLNLTGIITRGGITNVYLFSKDIPKRYLTLSTRRRTDSGVTLLSVARGLVQVDNNGVTEMLSFDTHKLPSIVTLPALKKTPTILKKKDDKSKEVKINIDPTLLKKNELSTIAVLILKFSLLSVQAIIVLLFSLFKVITGKPEDLLSEDSSISNNLA